MNKSLTNDSVTQSFNAKNPLKKAHRISNKTFIVIDEILARRLDINDEDTWLEQEEMENGIIMRIHRMGSR
jgi:hypothetical protein